MREFGRGETLFEEGAAPTFVYLTVSGRLTLERRRELDADDDGAVAAAVKAGLFHDCVQLATLPSPLLVGDAPAVLGIAGQPCKVSVAGEGEGVRALAVSSQLFAQLLRHHTAELKALRDCCALQLKWLDERRAVESQRRRDRKREKELLDELSHTLQEHCTADHSPYTNNTSDENTPTLRDQLSANALRRPSCEHTTHGRFWKLWSAGAVLARCENASVASFFTHKSLFLDKGLCWPLCLLRNKIHTSVRVSRHKDKGGGALWKTRKRDGRRRRGRAIRWRSR